MSASGAIHAQAILERDLLKMLKDAGCLMVSLGIESADPQMLARHKSGVSLEGSPLLVMEGTRARGQENVEEVLRAGGAATGAAITEGRIRAANAKAAGRESFMQGLTGAASLFKSAF